MEKQRKNTKGEEKNLEIKMARSKSNDFEKLTSVTHFVHATSRRG